MFTRFIVFCILYSALYENIIPTALPSRFISCGCTWQLLFEGLPCIVTKTQRHWRNAKNLSRAQLWLSTCLFYILFKCVFLYSCVSDGTVQKIRYTGLYSLQHTNTVIQWTNQKRKRSQITPSNQKASSSLLIVEAPDQADCSLVRKVDGEGPVAVTDQTKPALKLYFWEIVQISFTGSWAVHDLQKILQLDPNVLLRKHVYKHWFQNGNSGV